MWAMTGVSEEDRLDPETAKAVLRRALGMARPFRATIAGALGFTALTTLGLVLGPVIVRYGVDHGIARSDGGVLRNAVGVYVAVVVVAYLSSRQQYVFVNRAGEGFLRALRLRVFDHIQRQ